MRRFHLDAPAVSVLSAAATYSALLSWSRFAEDSSAYLVPLFFLTAGIAAGGLLLRSLHLPRPVVALLQLAGVAIAINAMFAAEESLFGWLPTPSSLATVREALSDAVATAGQYAAPIPAFADDFAPIMIFAGVIVALLVDVLACNRRLVPAAGLPLLAVFTAPVSLVDGVSWPKFVLAATFYIFLLAADQAGRLSVWGRSPESLAVNDNQPHVVRFFSLVPSAARISVVGIGLATLSPLFLPENSNVFGGAGSGDGNGDGVSISNPIVDLQRDLVQGPDNDLLFVRTDQPDPSYYRFTVLDQFDGRAWSPGKRTIPANQRADGALPAPPGLDGTVPRQDYDAEVSATQLFETKWLPVPYPAARVSAVGDWRYDLDTMDLISADDDVSTIDEPYQVTRMQLSPQPQALADATSPPTQLRLDGTDLPSNMPASIGELARQVTAGATSQFEEAVMLQEWFRVRGGFEYSLNRGPGSGLRQLEAFLGTGPDSRSGYCEQFAAAMAIMARTLDIPARVAVGFLDSEPVGDQTFVFSTRDMHAWPELYFQGSGWIRFEPTPQDRADTIPAYTAGVIPAPESQIPTPTTTASQLDPIPSRQPDPSTETTTEDLSGSFNWALLVLLLGGFAAAAGALLGPRSLRNLARRRRLQGSDPEQRVEGAWAEVRATAIDLGIAWDDHVTLRQSARLLVTSLSTVEQRDAAVSALESLVLCVEESRYSPRGVSPEAAQSAVDHAMAVNAALFEHASVRRGRRALWFPASLWRGRQPLAQRSPLDARTGTGDSEVDRVSL